jgi:hypothetical protein
MTPAAASDDKQMPYRLIILQIQAIDPSTLASNDVETTKQNKP